MTQKLEIKVSCPVYESFRVAQVGSMFDIPITQKTTSEFSVESPPDIDECWKIGLIVGTSGSGKSTVAKHLYPNNIYTIGEWLPDKAVVDHFGDLPIKLAISLLTTVGFSSPPSWIKPYHVLSNGEKFRCDLARALSNDNFVVFDEFTSVVDRNVAKIGSAAIAKGIKSGKINCRFVAVTCHYDIAEWLEPDWVLDMATGTVSRRLLRRPQIEFEIYRCSTDAWKLFAKHHYLNGNLHRSASCFMAVWNENPVAFAGVLNAIGFKGRYKISRIVTLPDYQGIGIGGKFLDAAAEIYHRDGLKFGIVGSHPSIINHCKNSTLWRCREIAKNGFKVTYSKILKDGNKKWDKSASAGRAVCSFEYIGQ